MSSFGKIRVEGEGALDFLQKICTAQMNIPVGRIVYTQMLNNKGGIESDLTVSRLGEKSFLLVVPCATLQRDLSYLNKENNSNEVIIIDTSSAEGVLSIMGPNSRKLLEAVSPNNFSNLSHPFGTWKNIEIGSGLARAHRVSYVGELGWEIYISSDQCAHVFEEIWKLQKEFKFNMCGIHALDSCRIEKAYRHFGHDITDEDHVVDAGLCFTADLSKTYFKGKEAILKKRKVGSSKKMLQFKLNDPTKMIYHNEPIIRENKIVGYLTSGNYGHTLGGCVGLGYVDCKDLSNEEILSFEYKVDVAGEIVDAKTSLRSMYDPRSERVRM